MKNMRKLIAIVWIIGLTTLISCGQPVCFMGLGSCEIPESAINNNGGTSATGGFAFDFDDSLVVPGAKVAMGQTLTVTLSGGATKYSKPNCTKGSVPTDSDGNYTSFIYTAPNETGAVLCDSTDANGTRTYALIHVYSN